MSNSTRTVFCLGVLLVCSLPHYSQAADPVEIRIEIARLTSEVSQRLKRIAALESQLDSGAPRRVLKGYCPVTLVNEKRWVIGNADYNITLNGRVYFFADEQRKQEFEQSPDKYTPAIGGYDPVVWLEKGERIAGRRRHGVFYAGKIVLFASEDSLVRFCDDPSRYLILPKRVSLQSDSVEDAPADAHDTKADEEVKRSRDTMTTSRRFLFHRRRSRRR